MAVNLMAWCIIPGFSKYAISSSGAIIRIKAIGREKGKTYPGKLLKPILSTPGYYCVVLSENNIKFKSDIHRLVALVFIGQCPHGLEVNHINGNKKDNRHSNLEYVSRSDNRRHAYLIGLRGRGSRHWSSKLKENDVTEIVNLYTNGMGHSQIAKRYGIRRESVRDILRGNNWSWFTGIKPYKRGIKEKTNE